MRGRAAQATLAHVGGFDHEMGCHRGIAEQPFADLDQGMMRGYDFGRIGQFRFDQFAVLQS
jgi:hypothetical protein